MALLIHEIIDSVGTDRNTMRVLMVISWPIRLSLLETIITHVEHLACEGLGHDGLTRRSCRLGQDTT